MALRTPVSRVQTAYRSGARAAVKIAYRPPLWLEAVIWLPLAAALCAALLRPLKGLMVAAQFANKASEARRDDV